MRRQGNIIDSDYEIIDKKGNPIPPEELKTKEVNNKQQDENVIPQNDLWIDLVAAVCTPLIQKTGIISLNENHVRFLTEKAFDFFAGDETMSGTRARKGKSLKSLVGKQLELDLTISLVAEVKNDGSILLYFQEEQEDFIDPVLDILDTWKENDTEDEALEVILYYEDEKGKEKNLDITPSMVNKFNAVIESTDETED